MPKFLTQFLNKWFSFLDAAYDKTTEAAEKVALKKEADYRTLMAKDDVPPMKVWQVRRLADPYELISIVVNVKPMSEKTLATKENRYLTNQYDNCEVVRVHGWERMLILTIKPNVIE